MKIESVEYQCDRCKKKIREERTYIFQQGVTMERVYFYAMNHSDGKRDYSAFSRHLDLCKECRKNLEVWLGGKNA